MSTNITTKSFPRASIHSPMRSPEVLSGPHRRGISPPLRFIFGGVVGLILLVGAISAFAHKPPPPPELPNMPPDNWGGRNAHILGSALIGTGTNLLWPNRPVAAFGACMLPGVVHEIRDYDKGQAGYRNGLFSRKDLLADAVGCGIGYGTAKGVRWMIGPRAAYLSAEF